jgi:hypothetical protein
MTKTIRLKIEPTSLVRVSPQRGRLCVPISTQTLTNARSVGATQARLATHCALHDRSSPHSTRSYAPKRHLSGDLGSIAAILSP